MSKIIIPVFRAGHKYKLLDFKEADFRHHTRAGFSDLSIFVANRQKVLLPFDNGHTTNQGHIGVCPFNQDSVLRSLKGSIRHQSYLLLKALRMLLRGNGQAEQIPGVPHFSQDVDNCQLNLRQHSGIWTLVIGQRLCPVPMSRVILYGPLTGERGFHAFFDTANRGICQILIAKGYGGVLVRIFNEAGIHSLAERCQYIL
jgi:hypothetical protein